MASILSDYLHDRLDLTVCLKFHLVASFAQSSLTKKNTNIERSDNNVEENKKVPSAIKYQTKPRIPAKKSQ